MEKGNDGMQKNTVEKSPRNFNHPICYEVNLKVREELRNLGRILVEDVGQSLLR